jgi:hypothetical protein
MEKIIEDQGIKFELNQPAEKNLDFYSEICPDVNKLIEIISKSNSNNGDFISIFNDSYDFETVNENIETIFSDENNIKSKNYNSLLENYLLEQHKSYQKHSIVHNEFDKKIESLDIHTSYHPDISNFQLINKNINELNHSTSHYVNDLINIFNKYNEKIKNNMKKILPKIDESLENQKKYDELLSLRKKKKNLFMDNVVDFYEKEIQKLKTKNIFPKNYNFNKQIDDFYNSGNLFNSSLHIDIEDIVKDDKYELYKKLENEKNEEIESIYEFSAERLKLIVDKIKEIYEDGKDEYSNECVLGYSIDNIVYDFSSGNDEILDDMKDMIDSDVGSDESMKSEKIIIKKHTNLAITKLLEIYNKNNIIIPEDLKLIGKENYDNDFDVMRIDICEMLYILESSSEGILGFYNDKDANFNHLEINDNDNLNILNLDLFKNQYRYQTLSPEIKNEKTLEYFCELRKESSEDRKNQLKYFPDLNRTHYIDIMVKINDNEIREYGIIDISQPEIIDPTAGPFFVNYRYNPFRGKEQEKLNNHIINYVKKCSKELSFDQDKIDKLDQIDLNSVEGIINLY